MFACLLKCCQINFPSAVPCWPLKCSLRVYVCLTCTCYPIVLSRIYVLCIFIVPAEPNSSPPPVLLSPTEKPLRCIVQLKASALSLPRLSWTSGAISLYFYTHTYVCLCVCVFVCLSVCLFVILAACIFDLCI